MQRDEQHHLDNPIDETHRTEDETDGRWREVKGGG